jgi:hypothetical protein
MLHVRHEEKPRAPRAKTGDPEVASEQQGIASQISEK